MPAHQDILYNVTGQSLYWDAWEGRASSVTSVSVYQWTTGDNGTTESATTGSGAVETNPNTTLDDSAAVGTRTIPLAATTGIAIGRTYLITGQQGETEWVTVAEINSGVSVIVTDPIKNAFVSSDTFEGTRISISIDSTWIADESNISTNALANPGYRVAWTYVVASVTYRHDSYFDVGRYTPGHSVTPAMMRNHLANWGDILPTYHREDNGRRLIDKAFDIVKADLYNAQIPDEQVRDVDHLNLVVMDQAVVRLIKERVYASTASEIELSVAQADYDNHMNQLFRVTPKVPIGTDTSGAGGHVLALGAWSK